MTVSQKTQELIRQWKSLFGAASDSDEESLLTLLDILLAYHSSFSRKTQDKLETWLNTGIANGGTIGTSDYTDLRIATDGVDSSYWSLSSVQMAAFERWLDTANGFSPVQYRVAAGELVDRSVDSPPVWSHDSGAVPYTIIDGAVLTAAGGSAGNQGNDAGYATSATGHDVPAAYQVAADWWDREKFGSPLTYEFTVSPGVEVIVRVFLGEGFHTSAAQRVFTITVDGAAPDANWEDIDLFSLYGKGVGVMYQATVTPASSTLTVSATASVDNATFRAIEIGQGVTLTT